MQENSAPSILIDTNLLHKSLSCLTKNADGGDKPYEPDEARCLLQLCNTLSYSRHAVLDAKMGGGRDSDLESGLDMVTGFLPQDQRDQLNSALAGAIVPTPEDENRQIHRAIERVLVQLSFYADPQFILNPTGAAKGAFAGKPLQLPPEVLAAFEAPATVLPVATALRSNPALTGYRFFYAVLANPDAFRWLKERTFLLGDADSLNSLFGLFRLRFAEERTRGMISHGVQPRHGPSVIPTETYYQPDFTRRRMVFASCGDLRAAVLSTDEPVVKSIEVFAGSRDYSHLNIYAAAADTVPLTVILALRDPDFQRKPTPIGLLRAALGVAQHDSAERRAIIDIAVRFRELAHRGDLSTFNDILGELLQYGSADAARNAGAWGILRMMGVEFIIEWLKGSPALKTLVAGGGIFGQLQKWRTEGAAVACKAVELQEVLFRGGSNDFHDSVQRCFQMPASKLLR